MKTAGWRCPECGVQNRIYTGGQLVVAVLLGLFVFFFMLKR
jgi:hypothetical protein